MSMETRPAIDRFRFERMTTEELRQAFLVEGLFGPDEVRLVQWESERTIIGSAVPSSFHGAMPVITTEIAMYSRVVTTRLMMIPKGMSFPGLRVSSAAVDTASNPM